ncbi:ACL158Wp [Eremothecium gossypii ATCC 10895]|uniref:ACL158Wp n=1 Tax=Eremothecium gossypii (strain ATCC 10895 / CBS 109.51 / FGSC 9923 / NRRL Y-1056) TaxID=284811 RepID=Q75CS7_EREGS|nr:ACL158Wp [Eremothecium gossypii ATCC 10895]AAS51070.1 ACL158Wp [Eremothecium gossypii ATCC 10895]AEY95360.1 FACL158Wp [Eremothecium gossypii FDAG1]
MSEKIELSQEPAIPTDTIARLFHTCSFTQDSTKITEDAVTLVERYMKLFIREAVLRSLENKEKVKQETRADSFAEGPVLQHTDLEEISGVLILDF